MRIANHSTEPHSQLCKTLCVCLNPIRVQTLLDSCKAAGGKRVKGLKVGDSVDAYVELVKDDPMYLVVSLPAHAHALAYLPSCDYNIQHASRMRTFQPGQKVSATVAAVKGPNGRVLLSAPLATVAPAPKTAKGKAKPGTVATGRVTAVHATHADLQVSLLLYLIACTLRLLLDCTWSGPGPCGYGRNSRSVYAQEGISLCLRRSCLSLFLQMA